jgi:hypothetical protein
VREKALVARWFDGYVVAGASVLDCSEDAENRVCVADIDDQKHKD